MECDREIFTMEDSLFTQIIGQTRAVEECKRAIYSSFAAQTTNDSSAQTWLFTGPAGSGRSRLARCFAAGLQSDNGLENIFNGELPTVASVLTGTHPDVREIIPEGLTIGVDEIRDIIVLAAHRPVRGKWNIILIEDADRLTEGAANALLKTIEEPPPATLIFLCAPSADPSDIPATIRSRCRHVQLVTPTREDIASTLETEGIDKETAYWASAVSAGHIGRARRLAQDTESRKIRELILTFPRAAVNYAQTFPLVDEFLSVAESLVLNTTEAANEEEMNELKKSLGDGAGKVSTQALRGTAPVVKALEKKHKNRSTRMMRDVIDICLIDLIGLLRDVMLASMKADVDHINIDHRQMIVKMAQYAPARTWLSCIETVFTTRTMINQNVKIKLALSSMMAAFNELLTTTNHNSSNL